LALARIPSVCKLSFLPCKFNWLNANAIFGRDNGLKDWVGERGKRGSRDRSRAPE